MFVADTINFREIVMKEPLPLATIQNAVIDFLRGRDDVVLFGAQAVNVYVNEPRATQDVDLMSTRAAELAEELRDHLSQLFHVAVRVREIKDGLGYRIFQLQKTGNRHLVNVRMVASFPELLKVDGVNVLSPAELIASKVISFHQRRGKPKSGTDWRDLALLLLTFPELKCDPGPVTDCLNTAKVDQNVMAIWHKLVEQEILPQNDEDDF
ncbi:MAG: nucleotidyl transferase AbiEii/AbiGii toxin family protein [Acidobacteria bacterium]|nr:nucleotidyl transferase AbiEii/AbiGii toxin family protein [Acidobacteriota bacterium]